MGASTALAAASCGRGTGADASTRDLGVAFNDRVAEIVAGVVRPNVPARRFDAGDFGLSAGGDARPAINSALAAANEAGGGRVVVPPGAYRSDGPIQLQSRCELHLSEGAKVTFSGDPTHYLPIVFTRWEGVEAYNYSPFIYGRGLSDVAITGAGVFDGEGAANWLPMRPKQKADQTLLREMGRTGVPLNERRFGAGRWLRPHFLQIIDAERVLIEGVTFLDSPFWVVHPVYCRHVTVRNIKVVSEHVNSDGVDPDSCEDVLIENCDFNTGDDGVAIKAGRDQDGWRVDRPCRRVVVRDCRYTGTAGGGMAIGSEMSGGVEEVFVDGYDMNEVKHGIYLKSNSDRGGYVRDCHFRRIAVAKAKDLIVVTNNYKEQGSGRYPALFENVTFSGVRADTVETAISIVGAPSIPVRGFTIADLRARAAGLPLRTRNVEDLTFVNVSANGEAVDAVLETPPETHKNAAHY
ncbi:MAG: glycoside hydrolase family 28 protein [Parvularculaceae bacterium]